MGKSTISMAIFNSYVSLPEGISLCHLLETKCSPQTDQPVSAAEVLLVEGRDDAAAKGRTSNDFWKSWGCSTSCMEGLLVCVFVC